MRLIEIVLFLSPFAAFAALRLLSPSQALPRWAVPALAVSVVAMLGLLLFLRGRDAGDADLAYVPARMDNGRIVPGHAAPR
ncbi:DUF6111 family protein [Rhodopila sp.]|jgi:hypothetical protein|uniref:DUF6111 family protein n=1 Tax=Rhodopila sp. TaxID=2480087 RepID=UPI002B911361|nr:DUF6111 family protein [Rhodopila sp.]HVZ08567.1 DUF6111 family protein [Rhodopila sp.]